MKQFENKLTTSYIYETVINGKIKWKVVLYGRTSVFNFDNEIDAERYRKEQLA